MQKASKVVKLKTILSVLAFKHLISSHPTQKSPVSPTRVNFWRWPNWTKFGDSIAKSCQSWPISQKRNVSSNQDCFSCDTVDRHQCLKKQSFRKLPLPISRWPLHHFVSNELVFLEKKLQISHSGQIAGKIFSELKFLWYYDKVFNFKHFFLNMYIKSQPPLI